MHHVGNLCVQFRLVRHYVYMLNLVNPGGTPTASLASITPNTKPTHLSTPSPQFLLAPDQKNLPPRQYAQPYGNRDQLTFFGIYRDS